MKLVLIACARTEWQPEGRLLGNAAPPLAAGAEAELDAWAEALRPIAPRYLLHSPDDLAKSTARRIARLLRSAARSVGALREVDTGLWTGLTDDELRERFNSTYRELCDAPLNVSPPQGESFAAAADRLSAYLRRRLKRNGDTAIGLVLRPCALALTHCLLEGGTWGEFWPRVLLTGPPFVLEVDATLRMLEGSSHG